MEKYDVKKIVGEGSYGKAILCKRKADAKLCIIKQISIKKLSRKEALLTEQEATLLKRLQHPNIVTFWESFVSNSSLHIVMEYADGGDLDHYIKAHAKSIPRRDIPEKQVLHMFVQLSLAIKHIHDRKILHRDLKSQNVFLTSSGSLKLGDFGVSRVLRHTVELAATQIGTPYYMSPEIMDNQRYNSKTDIWSLGCILYELMCLRLPFDGASMKQLCYNIIKMNPASPSMAYSPELRELVRDTLHKNPKIRPGINSILSRPIMRSKISALLGQTQQRAEFSHTVLHGANVLNSAPLPVPAGAAAALAPPPSHSAAPNQARYPQHQQQLQHQQMQQRPAAGARPSSGNNPAAPPVLSSAAQAVAMLQQQRQQQLMRQAQNQAQQQQYVGAMAAQMKEQIEAARVAEAARVRAQQQQWEEQQQRLKQQAVAKAKEQQQQQAQLQQQAERQRAVELLKRQQAQQQLDQLEKMKRAALAEQQRKLDQRRQERLEYEREKEKEKEKLRIQAQRQQQLLLQQQQARRISASPVPPAATPVPAPVPVPVRQFSAGALLARRRHSAPEQAPPAYLARPSSANQLPPSNAAPVSKPDNPFQAIIGNGANKGADAGAKQKPAVREQPPPRSQQQAPTKAPVPQQQQAYFAVPKPAVPKNTPPAPAPAQAPAAGKGTPRSAKRQPWNDDVTVVSAPVPEPTAGAGVRNSPMIHSPYPSSPIPVPVPASPALAAAAAAESPSSRAGEQQSDLRKLAAQNAIAQAQQVLQSVQGMKLQKAAQAQGQSPAQQRRQDSPAAAAPLKGGGIDRAVLDVSACSDGSSEYGEILPDTPQQTAEADSVVAEDCSLDDLQDATSDDDGADSLCAKLAPPPAFNAVGGVAGGAALLLDAVSVSASDADGGGGGGGAGSPWLSDLMGQMGVLKSQMKNLQQQRSPALQQQQPHRQPLSMLSSPDIRAGAAGDGTAAGADTPSKSSAGATPDSPYSASSSPVSSITAASPAPSAAAAAAHSAELQQQRGRHYTNAGSAKGNGNQQQHPSSRPPLANAGNGSSSKGNGVQPPPEQQPMSRSGKMSSQRMSFPLSSDDSTTQLKKQQQREKDLVSADDSSVASSKDPAALRKENRARQHADFKAFVQAQRNRKHGGGSGGGGGKGIADGAADAEFGAAGSGPDAGLEQGSMVSAYSEISNDDSDYSASPAPTPFSAAGPVLRIKVPPARVGHHHGSAASSDNTPSSSAHPMKSSKAAGASPGVALSGKGSAQSSKARPTAAAHSKGRGSAPSQKGPSRAFTPRTNASSAASSPHSSYGESPSSGSAAGFNVEEFRSQRDAQRREMRQLMQERRKQLQQHLLPNEDTVEAPDPPASYAHSEMRSYHQESYEVSTEVVAEIPEVTESPPVAAPRVLKVPSSGDSSMGGDESRLFAHLKESDNLDHLGHFAVPCAAPLAVAAPSSYLGESFVQQQQQQQLQVGRGPGGGAAGAAGVSDISLMEYSVLIEQMQAILRQPAAAGGHAGASFSNTRNKHQQLFATPAQHNDGSKAAAAVTATGAGAQGAPFKGEDTLHLPPRALLNELLLEEDDEEDEEGAGKVDKEVPEVVAEGEQEQEQEEEEDPDAFEEEDFALHLMDDPEGEGEGEGADGANEDAGDAGSETDDYADADNDDCCWDAQQGMQNEVLNYGPSSIASNPSDPFMQPLVPSMLTADVMLLDPLRVVESYHHQRQHRLDQHHLSDQHQHTPDKSKEAERDTTAAAAAVTVKAGMSAAVGTSVDAAEKARRLQVAELQEYLVSQLGSAKVSQALHLLSVNTAATLVGASPGEGERADSYYDEKDEELLNKIEDILGADSLHYLDDMLLLLTLQ